MSLELAEAAPDRPAFPGPLAWAARVCPLVFLVFSLVGSLFVAWNQPPFLAADEYVHLLRAELTTRGRLIGERLPHPTQNRLVAGGPGSLGLQDAQAAFDDLIFHPENQADLANFEEGGRASWRAPTTLLRYPGSAAYPPLFYLPHSLAIGVGKLANLPVVQTVYLARLANAAAYAAIGFAALLLAGRSRLYLFTLLLLPMALAIAGSVTVDAMMIAVTALGAALVCRAIAAERPLSTREVVGAAVCFGAVGATKLPYILPILVLLFAPVQSRRARSFAVAGAVVAALVWTLWMADAVQTPLIRGPGVPNPDPGGQLRSLLSNPGLILPIAAQTLAAFGRTYAEGFVGILGWLDTPLPAAYYALAWLVLAVAAAVAASGSTAGWRPVAPAAAALAILVAAGVFLALYATWTPVGSLEVEGVQGRYFLPVAAFLAVALEGRRPLLDGVGSRVQAVVAAGLLSFPVLSILVIERAVILRYYLD